MHYMVMDTGGNAISAFESGADAMLGFEQIVREHPDSAPHIALLAFDEDGEAVGDALVAADVAPELVTRLALSTAGWHPRNSATLFSWELEHCTRPLVSNDASTAPIAA